uniref:Uncharacterized protein LOC104225909 n=2 Tax=Nicotiana sylvestris TaxID=4096 RepID=A0A1U7W7V8_NICSY|nr:PREDICTED: uncharacterized protein LOC104225909 [Nicotiana sylvestris]
MVVNPKGGNNTGHAMTITTRSGKGGDAPTSNQRKLVNDELVVQEYESPDNAVQANDKVWIDIDDNVEETEEKVIPSRDHIVDIRKPVVQKAKAPMPRPPHPYPQRPFLATGKALVDVEAGELTFQVGDEKVVFCMCKSMRQPNNKEVCSFVDLVTDVIVDETIDVMNVNDTLEDILLNFDDDDIDGFIECDYLEVFMDNFSMVGNSFDDCLANLDKLLASYEETNLVLNWEKCHFMVGEGIILGHKISNNGIEVDKAKIEVISKLSPPTSVKGMRSFLGHAGFYWRFIKDFDKLVNLLCKFLEKDSKFHFNDDCMRAFELLNFKLTTTPTITASN